jgi:hypothetical protein
MTTPYSGSRGDMLTNAHVTSHLRQPNPSADLDCHLPECIDFDDILRDFDFASMDSVDPAAPAQTFAFNQMLADPKPSSAATFQCFNSP